MKSNCGQGTPLGAHGGGRWCSAPAASLVMCSHRRPACTYLAIIVLIALCSGANGSHHGCSCQHGRQSTHGGDSSQGCPRAGAGEGADAVAHAARVCEGDFGVELWWTHANGRFEHCLTAKQASKALWPKLPVK